MAHISLVKKIGVTEHPGISDYKGPDREAFCRLLHDGTHNFLDNNILNERNSLDNRTTVRMILLLRGVKRETYDQLVEPYDTGFYRRTDGKSSPLGIFKIAPIQRKLGFTKDIVSIRHDLDYYSGVERSLADARYRDNQIELGYPKWRAIGEYWALRAFGWKAWNKHKTRRENIAGYGTLAYIAQMPVFSTEV
ncbi:MAG: hypothetical protein ACC707_01165 [Thiohalomonadales bacterium]